MMVYERFFEVGVGEVSRHIMKTGLGNYFKLIGIIFADKFNELL